MYTWSVAGVFVFAPWPKATRCPPPTQALEECSGVVRVHLVPPNRETDMPGLALASLLQLLRMMLLPCRRFRASLPSPCGLVEVSRYEGTQ